MYVYVFIYVCTYSICTHVLNTVATCVDGCDADMDVYVHIAAMYLFRCMCACVHLHVGLLGKWPFCGPA